MSFEDARARVHQQVSFIDNLLVRIRFIIVMIRWAGLAPWEFEFRAPADVQPSSSSLLLSSLELSDTQVYEP